MAQEYKTIKVKKEVHEKLEEAAKKLNQKASSTSHNIKVTIAGLVGRVADAYNSHMSELVLTANTEDWILDGIPIITTSDAAKHYKEVLNYEPAYGVLEIGNMIRNIAMDKRFARLANEK